MRSMSRLREGGGDVDHRRRGLFEQGDGRFLVVSEVAAGFDGARLGGGIEQGRLGGEPGSIPEDRHQHEQDQDEPSEVRRRIARRIEGTFTDIARPMQSEASRDAGEDAPPRLAPEPPLPDCPESPVVRRVGCPIFPTDGPVEPEPVEPEPVQTGSVSRGASGAQIRISS